VLSPLVVLSSAGSVKLSQSCTTQLNQANLIGSSEKANMIRITTKKTIIQIIPVRENVIGFVFATILSFPCQR
jgi:hypothetical protein